MSSELEFSWERISEIFFEELGCPIILTEEAPLKAIFSRPENESQDEIDENFQAFEKQILKFFIMPDQKPFLELKNLLKRNKKFQLRRSNSEETTWIIKNTERDYSNPNIFSFKAELLND